METKVAFYSLTLLQYMFSNKFVGGTFPLFFLVISTFSPTFLIADQNRQLEILKRNEESYIEWLIGEGDYYRAIGELRKLQWYSPPTSWFTLELRILRLYQLSGHIKEGLSEWENFSKLHPKLIKDRDKWLLTKVKLLLSLKHFSEAYPYLATISSLPNGRKIANLLLKRKRILLSPSPGDRSPVMAGILSAIIPGAGEWYAGLPGNGIFTFFVVSFLGAGSYYLHSISSPAFYIVFPLTLLFYTGNIYGAITSTYRMNLIKKNIRWNNLKNSSNWDFLIQIKF